MSSSQNSAVSCTGPSVHVCPAGSGMISGQTGCYACDINTYNDGSSLYCLACPMYQKAFSRGSSNCSYYKNFVTYRSKKYATLADTPIDSEVLQDSQVLQGQHGYFPLMNFTSIAAEEENSQSVVSDHRWGSQFLIISGGCMICTGVFRCYPTCRSSNLRQQGDSYGVPQNIGSHILITCKLK